MTPSRNEQATDRPSSPAASSSGMGGSWRRKSLLAVTVLGLGLYLRHRRSSTGDTTMSDGGADGIESVDRIESQDTDADQSSGRSLGRRLVMMALSTLAVTLARRAFRRLRRAR